MESLRTTSERWEHTRTKTGWDCSQSVWKSLQLQLVRHGCGTDEHHATTFIRGSVQPHFFAGDLSCSGCAITLGWARVDQSFACIAAPGSRLRDPASTAIITHPSGADRGR